MGNSIDKRKQIIEKLQGNLKVIEGGDAKIIEEIASTVSATLIGWEHELGKLDPEFLEIEHLALDLEIPKKFVDDYDSTLRKLKEKIQALRA